MNKFIFLFSALIFLLFYNCNQTKQSNESCSYRLQIKTIQDSLFNIAISDPIVQAAILFQKENFLINYSVNKYPSNISEIINYSDSLISLQLPYADFSKLMSKKIAQIPISEKLKKARIIHDLDVMTSSQIIENTKEALSVWPNDWNREIDFSVFSNYILPFRAYHEPFEKWRDSYFKEYSKLYELDTLKSIWTLTKLLESEINQHFRYFDSHSFQQSAMLLKRGKFGNCVDYAIWIACAGRSIGLPITIDKTTWAHAFGNHFWNAVYLTNDSTVNISRDHFHRERGWSYSKVGKIYRITNEINQEVLRKIEAGQDRVYRFRDINSIDVTHEYVPVSDLHYTITERQKSEYAYLCIFNNLNWTPVACERIGEDGEILFENVGRDVVYQIMQEKKQQLVPASQPLFVNKEGGIEYLEPSHEKRNACRFNRKYILKDRIVWFAQNMIGSCFIGANTKSFQDADTLCTVQDTILSPTLIKVNNNQSKGYRYMKFISSVNKPCDVAEISFYKSTGEKVELIEVNGTPQSENAFDNDPLSYCNISQSEGKELIFDFGEPQEISEVKVLPRSDVNYIRKNCKYALFYWDYGWNLIDTKIASKNYIDFDNVPEGSLLWLRNLTEGNEESVFIMENGKQYFF